MNEVSRSLQVALSPICKAWSCQVIYMSRIKVSSSNITRYETVKRVNNRMLNIAVPGFVVWVSCPLAKEAS